MTPADYADLIRRADALKKQLANLETEHRLKSQALYADHKCKTVEGARKKMSYLKSKRERLQTEAAAEMEEWERDFGKNF